MGMDRDRSNTPAGTPKKKNPNRTGQRALKCQGSCPAVPRPKPPLTEQGKCASFPVFPKVGDSLPSVSFVNVLCYSSNLEASLHPLFRQDRKTRSIAFCTISAPAHDLVSQGDDSVRQPYGISQNARRFSLPLQTSDCELPLSSRPVRWFQPTRLHAPIAGAFPRWQMSNP